jgi:hypothetical protein
MLVAAAFVPMPPLLVPEIAGGSAAADQALRDDCHAAITRLLAAGLEELVVVGPGPVDGPADGSWDWRGFGVPLPAAAPPQRLPLGLAIGCWLLETHPGVTPPRRCHAVSADLPAQQCAELGRALVSGDRRIGLLVTGDGSACRTEKAPGHLDPDALTWDEAALSGLRDADPAALLQLDTAVGRRVLAAGRAPWQVLAGAAADGAFEGAVDRAEAPYGVLYVVGTWLAKGVEAG